jgi:hypothetical protein
MTLREAVEILHGYLSDEKIDQTLYMKGEEVMGIAVVVAEPPFKYGPEPTVNGVEIEFNTRAVE